MVKNIMPVTSIPGGCRATLRRIELAQHPDTRPGSTVATYEPVTRGSGNVIGRKFGGTLMGLMPLVEVPVRSAGCLR